jgi:hypothetical protein
LIVGTQEWALPDRRLSQYLAGSIPARARCLGGVRSPRGAPLTPAARPCPAAMAINWCRHRSAAPRGRHGIEDDGVHPPSRATLTNPPARLAARPISSQGRAGAPVRASPCQDHDDQSPPGYDLDPPSGRSRSDHPRTGQKRYINVGRTARRSALGPGSPTGSRRCSQKAFSVGSNPTRGTSRDYNPKPRYNVSSC